jgi:hypothetical protein
MARSSRSQTSSKSKTRSNAVSRRSQQRKVTTQRKAATKRKLAKRKLVKGQTPNRTTAKAKKVAARNQQIKRALLAAAVAVPVLLSALPKAKAASLKAAGVKAIKATPAAKEPSRIIQQVVYQPDANTCQSACIAKVLGTQDVYAIRADLEAMGVSGDPEVMAAYLEPRVKAYRFTRHGSLADARKALDEGYTIITHGWFTSAGHVITLVGHEADPGGGFRFLVDDPWGEFHFPSATYDNQANGDNLPYSSRGIYAYCVGSNSFEEAQVLYDQKALDLTEANAWLHLIKN